jgi:uncharacterized membrane protein
MPEEITSVTEEMDLTQYLPELEGLQSGLTTFMRILVLAGPVIMLLLGLYYFFLSPKEANYKAGYRFRYAMSRVGVWRFAQRVAGIAYGGLGLVLTIVMICLVVGFSEMNSPDLVWYAVKCILWQIILVLVATLAVDAVIIIRYDHRGALRKDSKKKTKTASSKKAASKK